jgi:flagellar assembly factor FliW
MVDATAETDVRTIAPARFGSITYRDDDLIVFPWGIPGFDHLKSFLVVSVPGQDHLMWFQSIEDLSVALPAADPWLFFPTYDPRLPAFARVALDLEKPEDFTILGIVAAPGDGTMFMNLMAPVIVNLRSRIARQVALEQSGYTVATPVPLIDPAVLKAAAAGAPTVAEAEPIPE